MAANDEQQSVESISHALEYLNQLFDERIKLYDSLEPNFERDIVEELNGIRNQIDALLKIIAKNQSKSISHPLLQTSTSFSIFVLRYFNIYCNNDSEIVDRIRRTSEYNSWTTEEEVEKRLIEKHRVRTTTALNEVYGRTIVEQIDDTLSETSGISEKMKEYLIKRKQEILFSFPEVESWYLGRSFFGSKDNLGSVDNFDEVILHTLDVDEEEYSEFSREFWQYSAAIAAGELISASCKIDDGHDVCLQNYCKLKYIAACKFVDPDFYDYAQGMVTGKNINPEISEEIKGKILLFSKKEEN